MKINYYENINEGISAINSWQDPQTLINDGNTISDISVIELELKDLNINDSIVEKEIFYELIHEVIDELKIKPFLILTEHKIQAISRIRTYRGLIPKDIISLQNEIVFSNNQSIISSICNIDNSSREFVEGRFMDSTNCCIVLSYESSFYCTQFLDKFVRNYMVHNNLSVINYLNLCEIVAPDTILCRVAGNRQTIASLQFFINKSAYDVLLNLVIKIF